jgi:hypothetical protein
VIAAINEGLYYSTRLNIGHTFLVDFCTGTPGDVDIVEVEVEVEKREISESPGLSISFEYRLGGCRR